MLHWMVRNAVVRRWTVMHGHDNRKSGRENREDEKNVREDAGDASDAGAISWPAGRARCVRETSTPTPSNSIQIERR